eukprot:7061889-Lingulodinium_polyedra.AAC.1
MEETEVNQVSGHNMVSALTMRVGQGKLEARARSAGQEVAPGRRGHAPSAREFWKMRARCRRQGGGA